MPHKNRIKQWETNKPEKMKLFAKWSIDLAIQSLDFSVHKSISYDTYYNVWTKSDYLQAKHQNKANLRLQAYEKKQ